MNHLVSSLRAAVAFVVALTFGESANAQDSVGAELKLLRQQVEMQSKQIDTLAAQVAKLQVRMDLASDPAKPTPPPAPAPAAQPPTTAEATPPAALPPKPANVHIVVKGESLDKIARTHNTTAAELQKLNRIAQPKKLQVGQQLVLPPSTPKKENQ